MRRRYGQWAGHDSKVLDELPVVEGLAQETLQLIDIVGNRQVPHCGHLRWVCGHLCCTDSMAQ